MSLNVVVGLIVAVIGLVAYWFKKKFSYWEDRGFQFVKPDFPFGSLKGVGYKVHFSQKTRQFYEQFKKEKAVGMYFFSAPTVLLTDLNTIQHVLVKDFSNFHDRGIYSNASSDPLSVCCSFNFHQLNCLN